MSVTEVPRSNVTYGKHTIPQLWQTVTQRNRNMILRLLAECDENYISPEIDSAAVELYDVTFRRLRLPRKNISAEHDKSYVSVSDGRDEIDGFLNVG